jgi:D-3-phosphoglycerate dehydrogenase
MPTVLVTDYTFPDLEIETSILEPIGCKIKPHQCRTEADLLAVVSGADWVLTQFAPVNARVIAALDKTRLIVRYGIGVDNVDLDAAAARGIPVCNVPDFCLDEVADHTLALILACTRQIVPNDRVVREGSWTLGVGLDRMGSLRGRTVGIVGFGKIGRDVAARLRGFKCRLLAYDPFIVPDVAAELRAEPVSLDELLSSSDLVSLHCPSNAQTKRLINREAIARMRPGSILVNVARGDVVETGALLDALRSGHLAAAALDVTDPEPLPADHPLRSLANVVFSAHIASASPTAARALRDTAANTIARVIRGEKVTNVVNGVAVKE